MNISAANRFRGWVTFPLVGLALVIGSLVLRGDEKFPQEAKPQPADPRITITPRAPKNGAASLTTWSAQGKGSPLCFRSL
jgi:hypothetical protein